jgi:chitin disaccharide deacetylase
MGMRVIINADDLGHSQEINSAIFELMAQRRITSATLLANGAGFDDAIARLREYPYCSFGAHLNLTDQRPLSGAKGLAPILDPDGNFVMNKIRTVRIDQSLREAVVEEWLAQVEKIRSAGVPISHLDSHHHVHTVSGLFGALKRVQKAAGIGKVRTTMNLYSPKQPAGKRLILQKKVWDFALRHYVATTSTDGFTSFMIFHEVAQQKALAQKTFELMVHPGTAAFDVETALLSEPWQQRMQFETKLISFNEL